MSATRASANHGLKRQLKLRDLVLTQVMSVVGASWVGVAAGLGRAQALIWTGSILVFYLPMAVSVYWLNREMPLEGGLYAWARRAFGDAGGFMTAWNLWAYGLCTTATIVMAIPTELMYLAGPGWAWLPQSHPVSLGISGALTVGMLLSALYGLSFGKWLYNVSGVSLMAVFGLLVLLPMWALLHHVAIHPDLLRVTVPAINARSMAFIGQMFGALCGLEYLAILAGETESPSRNIGLSVVIASPIICGMFILGTGSVLAFHELHADTPIDFIAPVPQTLRFALGQSPATKILATGAILLILIRELGAASFLFTGATRLPMTAGWDHLLPARFSRLHPRYRTPAFSISVAAVVVAAMLLLDSVGVHAQEAYQVLMNSSIEFYALSYLAMFGIPLAGLLALRSRLPLWVKLTSVVGFAFTLYSFIVTAYPIVPVVDRRLYAMKTLGTVALVNGLGWWVYRSRKRKASIAAKVQAEMAGS